MLPVLIIGLAIGIALLAAVFGTDKPAGIDLETTMPMVGAVLMALAVGAGAIGNFRGQMSEGLKAVFAWVAIGFVIIAGYAYRFDLAAVGNRVVGAVVPGVMLFGAGGEVSVSRGADGQFHFGAIANGRQMRLMFDTGASSVVLTHEDAQDMGIKLNDADFTITVRTANGTTRAAPVTLKSMEIGGIREENVRAMIAQPGRLTENLLGMTFLERLSSYEVRGDQLTLRGRGR
jgi:aspartyl protease family protein